MAVIINDFEVVAEPPPPANSNPAPAPVTASSPSPQMIEEILRRQRERILRVLAH